jgi:hypothetical protein
MKPFTLSDLKPVPIGWRIGGPDFVGIGTAKAGTTWWYNLLLSHPQVVKNRLEAKELHYFEHFAHRKITEGIISIYKNAFASPEGGLCGEWSPGYLTYPFGIENLYATAPEAKILIILRNPIDGFYSKMNGDANGREKFYDFKGEKSYFYKTFDMYPRLILNSLYAVSLKKLLNYYNRWKILILQYEKCKLVPEEEIKKTYRFLGVDENYIPRSIQKPINKKSYVISKPDAFERKRLADYFLADVEIIKQMFPDEIDLSLWEDFREI